jgi:hypothetical protein
MTKMKITLTAPVGPMDKLRGASREGALVILRSFAELRGFNVVDVEIYEESEKA